eukprot:GHVS01065079.1.p1 GENE.GHVS01065079.1~~GHVS01065079.1.p1  ORF type:complete len:507 (-),score=108.70 GHVS01065079.1:165-1685(-)
MASSNESHNSSSACSSNESCSSSSSACSSNESCSSSSSACSASLTNPGSSISAPSGGVSAPLSFVKRRRVRGDVLYVETPAQIVQRCSRVRQAGSCYIFTYGQLMHAKELEWFCRVKVLSSTVAFIQGFALCFNLKGNLPFVSRSQAHLVMARGSNGKGSSAPNKRGLAGIKEEPQDGTQPLVEEEEEWLPTVYGIVHEVSKEDMQHIMSFLAPLEFYTFIPVKAYRLHLQNRQHLHAASTEPAEDPSALKKESSLPTTAEQSNIPSQQQQQQPHIRRRRQQPQTGDSDRRVEEGQTSSCHPSSFVGGGGGEEEEGAVPSPSSYFLQPGETLRMNPALCMVGNGTSVWRHVTIPEQLDDLAADRWKDRQEMEAPFTTTSSSFIPPSSSNNGTQMSSIARERTATSPLPLPSAAYLQLMTKVFDQYIDFPSDYVSEVRSQPTCMQSRAMCGKCLWWALTWWNRVCTAIRMEVVGWTLLEGLWLIDKTTAEMDIPGPHEKQRDDVKEE